MRWPNSARSKRRSARATGFWAGIRTHIEALNTRGVVLAKLHRFDEALASYDAALAAAPDRVDIEVNRGTALLELGRFDEAIAGFDGVACEPIPIMSWP